LPEPELESLGRHVLSCACCAAVVAGLPSGDTLLEAACQTPPADPEPAEVLLLIARMKALPDAGDAFGTTGHAPAASRDLELEFLAPARGDGELGWLGHYRILRVLGQGGMGVVLEAEDSLLQRQTAIKVMKSALAADPEARERFLREARLAASVTHENVVPILHVGEHDGFPYLVMPLLRGESLASRLGREKRLALAEVLRIGQEMADGLGPRPRQGADPSRRQARQRLAGRGRESQGAGFRASATAA
jgi:hypothetical protein